MGRFSLQMYLSMWQLKLSYIEQVKQYKYLRSIINDTNSIEEEVKERIAVGI